VRLSGLSDKPNGRNQPRNGWRFRLQSKVQNLRAHLYQLVAVQQSTAVSPHLQRVKSRIYQITDHSSVLITIESLKQCIVAFATCLRRYKEKLECHLQNRTFCSNQRKFYRHLHQDVSDYTGTPDNHQVMTFWRNLFEKNFDANLNCIWLSQLREKFDEEMDASDEEININNELFVKAFRG